MKLCKFCSGRHLTAFLILRLKKLVSWKQVLIAHAADNLQ